MTVTLEKEDDFDFQVFSRSWLVLFIFKVAYETVLPNPKLVLLEVAGVPKVNVDIIIICNK